MSDLSISPISNSNLPINRLPVEILLAIFSQIVARRTDDQSFDISKIISISSVCSNWRRIILNNPSFWSSIVVGKNLSLKGPCDILGLCLERSRDSLIDVSVHLYNSSDLDLTLTTLLPNIHRLHSVSFTIARLVHIDPALKSSILESVFTQRAPIPLQHLSINHRPAGQFLAYPTLQSWLPSQDPVSLSFIQTLFGQLQTLKIRGVGFDPLSSSFDHLQVLELGKPCSMQVLRSILTSAPNLSVLKLWLYKRSFSGFETTDSKLALPQGLRQLYIFADSYLFYTFLDWFTLGDHEVELDTNPSTFYPPPIEHLNDIQSVSTLFLTGSRGMHPFFVHVMLGHLPGLRTLVLRDTILDQLTMQPTIIRSKYWDFRTISCLKVHGCNIEDPDAFKALVNAHPISRLIISRCILKQAERHLPIKPDPSSPVHKWLSELSPGLSLTVSEY